jgi:CxxC motif-containing protein (DUF1111 family)
LKTLPVLARIAAVVSAILVPVQLASAQTIVKARDPGVRGGPPAAGEPYANLSANKLAAFLAAKDQFAETDGVDEGLGPTMNLDSCGGCHSHPAIGGSSPAVNPQVAFRNFLGANNFLPSFISISGPVREARFVRNPDGTPDGGVHALFTIAGRSDAPGCVLAQPNFAAQVAARNVVFRIPTPVYGTGLMEQIPDSTIRANRVADAALKQALGITGRTNSNGNDGTVTRFGWKAQNQSLLLFSAEAYNVEMGITNEIFQSERDETAGCRIDRLPNSVQDHGAATVIDATPSISKFAIFQRFLAPPDPSDTVPGGSASILRGRGKFVDVGCALCHTPTLRTGDSDVGVLRDRPAHLFSDLLVHDMGPALADGITQGQAGPSEFRTAPLWGLGQRIFFLHDGRTADLLAAIAAHQSGSALLRNASEANEVVRRFNLLTEVQKQDVLNFLRSL